MRSTHRRVAWLVEDKGGLRHRTINKSEETVLGDEEDSPAVHLLTLLGFVPIQGVMILANYKMHCALLEMFLHISKETLIYKGDPARFVSLQEIENVSTLVAYLVYHFRLRCCLLCEETPIHLLGDVFPEIDSSLGVVQLIADRLRIMAAGGPTRACWETVKEMIVAFVTKERDHASGRREVSYSLDEMARRLEMDLNLVVPHQLMSVFSYASNMQSVISLCRSKRAIQRRTAQVYASSVRRINQGAFSNEYYHINDQIVEILKVVNRRQLFLEEVEKVYELSVWQSENFLSHFRKETFASLDRSATSFGSQRRVDRTVLPLTEIVIVKNPLQSSRDSKNSKMDTNDHSQLLLSNPNRKEDDSAFTAPREGFVSESGTNEALALQGPVETDGHCGNERSDSWTSSQSDDREGKHAQQSHEDVMVESEEYLWTALSSTNADHLASLVDSLVASRGFHLVEKNVKCVLEAKDREAGKLCNDIEELEAAIEQTGGCEIVTGSLASAKQVAVDSLVLVSAQQSALMSVHERMRNFWIWRKKIGLGDLPKNTVGDLLNAVLSSVRSFQRQSLVSLVCYLPDELRRLLDS
jgi:hypothetical protein